MKRSAIVTCDQFITDFQETTKRCAVTEGAKRPTTHLVLHKIETV